VTHGDAQKCSPQSKGAVMAVDLSTQYLGLKLRCPLVVSACPLTGEMDVLARLEEAGAAAAVMPSLFEEQIEHKAAEGQKVAPCSYAESMHYFRELREYNRGPDVYLRHIEEAKKAVSIPIIGSLNGTRAGWWLRYARHIEQAGADALELNIHFIVTNPKTTATEVEQRYVDIVSAVREAVKIPLAVKMGPYFASPANLAYRLVAAGANGLVLFNRFWQPDINLEMLRIEPRLTMSSSDELLLPLQWIAILHGRIGASLAATGGVHFFEDVLKAMLVGADVAMIASALYRHGVDHIRALLDAMIFWLENNECPSIEQIKGSLSQDRCPDPAAFERANYTKALTSFTTGPV
jgi:dihydroorotate dehydrogenase (fumarate)